MIYIFLPILKETIWGGDKIAAFKGVESNSDHVGESWELSGVKGDESIVADGPEKGLSLYELLRRHKGELLGKHNYERFGDEFPLLIKFIDARSDLSIQVHPDDRLAKERHNSKGKTEMWYVVDATPDAHLRSGLKDKISPAEYVAAVENNTICDKLTDYNVHAGDVFFLPAGRIHSIGAGCFIAEIQQTSDITYRIYDFNRKDANGNCRQLHTELAKDAVDYTVCDDYRTAYTPAANEATPLVDCNYFNVALCEMSDNKTIELPDADTFTIVIGIEGDTLISAGGETAHVAAGETALVPASLGAVVLSAPAAKCLTARII